MISIICACNNEKILNEMLNKSLKKQNYKDYELIVIDAQKHGFNSASETLNYGASIANGEILVFIHQDIEFIYDNALEKIVEYCKDNEFAIAGLCGIDDTGEYNIYSSVTIGKTHRQAGTKINSIMNVYALDECCLIIKKEKFKKFEDFGKTWHFYAVEYCMRAKKQNENVLLFPIEMYHLSPGWSLDYSYFNTLIKVAKRYPDEKKIKTCMGVFKNNYFLSIYCMYRKLKIFIKKILHYQKYE